MLTSNFGLYWLTVGDRILILFSSSGGTGCDQSLFLCSEKNLARLVEVGVAIHASEPLLKTFTFTAGIFYQPLCYEKDIRHLCLNQQKAPL